MSLQYRDFNFLFMYSWLHRVFIAVCELFLVAKSRSYSSLQRIGFSLKWHLLLRRTGSRCAGFSSYSPLAQQLWHTTQASVASWHVLWSRDRTCLPCIARQIFMHCTTREVLENLQVSIAHNVHGDLTARILAVGLPFPPPVNHILSELFTMTCPSWVTLHSMAQSFTELCKPLHHDKAVIHERELNSLLMRVKEGKN